MSKLDDFGGGVQKDMVAELLQLIGTLVSGNLLPQADAIALLSALAATQTDALNPGSGQLGFLDAVQAYDKLDTAYNEWKLAKTAATVTPATASLVTAIKALQKLFKTGAIPNGFFTFP